MNQLVAHARYVLTVFCLGAVTLGIAGEAIIPKPAQTSISTAKEETTKNNDERSLLRDPEKPHSSGEAVGEKPLRSSSVNNRRLRSPPFRGLGNSAPWLPLGENAVKRPTANSRYIPAMAAPVTVKKQLAPEKIQLTHPSLEPLVLRPLISPPANATQNRAPGLAVIGGPAVWNVKTTAAINGTGMRQRP
jgi:hypothetical protein